MRNRDLYNPAALCGLLQTEFGRLTGAIESLGLQPEMRLNGLPYYSAEDVEKIRAALSKRRARRELSNLSRSMISDIRC